jgi:hypothetical protein
VNRAIKSAYKREDLDPTNPLRALIGAANVSSTPNLWETNQPIVGTSVSENHFRAIKLKDIRKLAWAFDRLFRTQRVLVFSQQNPKLPAPVEDHN